MLDFATRRDVLAGLAATTATAMLAAAGDAVAADRPLWARRTSEVTDALRGGAMSIGDWREAMDAVLGGAPLSDIAASIDTARLRAMAGRPTRGVGTARVRLASGAETSLSFIPKYFAIDAGRAIIPHGHANMVSAHVVLSGDMRLRQYDQVDRGAASLRVRQTRDVDIGPGAVSSIGEARDNVHWFVARRPAETLDIIVTGLGPADAARYEIFNLDMDAAGPRGDGTLDAPRLSVYDALAKYG